MHRPLVYIDMNVLVPLTERVPDLVAASNVQWVYSSEHFVEISRSANPQKFLTSLDTLDAKLIELELLNWKITGTAKLADGGTVFQHYASYCDNLNKVSVNESLFDPFLAWVNGGRDEGLLRDLPNGVLEQIITLTGGLPIEQRDALREAALQVDMTPMIEQMITSGNDINRTRAALGGGGGNRAAHGRAHRQPGSDSSGAGAEGRA